MEEYNPERPLREHGMSRTGDVQSVFTGALLTEYDSSFTIYTGPADRHQETAAVIVETIEAMTGESHDSTVLDELDDLDWGSEALLRAEELALEQQEWISATANGELPVNESIDDLRARLATARERIERDDPDDPVLLVTSAIVVSVFVEELLQADLSQTRFTVSNASVFELIWGEEDWLIQMNSVGHLPNRMKTRSWSKY
jgi:broad specificity phosphatase PhoE